MKAEFCSNSRRWVLFMVILPWTCPNKDENNCRELGCGYYEMKEVTRWYLEKKRILMDT